ncbi:hypothetical protein AVEN_70740-1 [Araneus ventricosus]|uniref:Uncharacterized protein n=1 Tax=Araneus ventricosus TaxID=182803 RepID=A0A4Y2KIZ7_ARAVE|nr:hypothetical protein AVEN_70740-1 [Araneus ventricosus]
MSVLYGIQNIEQHRKNIVYYLCSSGQCTFNPTGTNAFWLVCHKTLESSCRPSSLPRHLTTAQNYNVCPNQWGCSPLDLLACFHSMVSSVVFLLIFLVCSFLLIKRGIHDQACHSIWRTSCQNPSSMAKSNENRRGVAEMSGFPFSTLDH